MILCESGLTDEQNTSITAGADKLTGPQSADVATEPRTTGQYGRRPSRS